VPPFGGTAAGREQNKVCSKISKMYGNGRQHCDKTSKYSSTRHVGKQEQSYGTEDGERHLSGRRKACQVAGVDEGCGIGNVNERRTM